MRLCVVKPARSRSGRQGVPVLWKRRGPVGITAVGEAVNPGAKSAVSGPVGSVARRLHRERFTCAPAGQGRAPFGPSAVPVAQEARPPRSAETVGLRPQLCFERIRCAHGTSSRSRSPRDRSSRSGSPRDRSSRSGFENKRLRRLPLVPRPACHALQRGLPVLKLARNGIGTGAEAPPPPPRPRGEP